MKPLNQIATAMLPDGSELRLMERDGTFHLEQGLEALANTRASLPARHMVEMASQPFRPAKQPKILIDGLKLGTVLAAAQEAFPQKGASFILAEPKSNLVKWHREHLAELHPEMLDDERIDHRPESAEEVAYKQDRSLNVILVDCSGAPRSSTHQHPILSKRGLNAAAGALKDGGLFVVCSDTPDKAFGSILERNGFQVVEELCPPSEKSKSKRLHTIWIARKGYYQSQNYRSR